jgi:GGDEF domain-containing protein
LLNLYGLQARYPTTSFPPNFALRAIDLDGLKQIADPFGHAAGDAVLVDCCLAAGHNAGNKSRLSTAATNSL